MIFLYPPDNILGGEVENGQRSPALWAQMPIAACYIFSWAYSFDFYVSQGIYRQTHY